MAEAKELLEVAALVVPLATVVFQVGVHHQRLKNLEQRFAAFIENCIGCKSHLQDEDDTLHGRITEAEKDVAGLKGKMESVTIMVREPR